MNEASPTCSPQTSKDIPNAIGSPGSQDGPSPSSSPAGPQLDLFGRGLHPVSPSASPGSERGKMTSGTYGPHSSGSSASADLTRCLANRLAERFGTDGSMEYAETWKRRATPSGRVYWEHTASARRTSDSGCTGWPTARVPKYSHDLAKFKRDPGRKSPTDLETACVMAGWPTPCQQDGPNGGPSQGTDRLPGAVAGWPTARVQDSKHAQASPAEAKRNSLTAAVAGWATPQSRDVKGVDQNFHDGAVNNSLPNQALGLTSPSSPVPTASRGALNPEFVSWLMGFPTAWDGLGALATPLCPKSRRRSSKRS